MLAAAQLSLPQEQAGSFSPMGTLGGTLGHVADLFLFSGHMCVHMDTHTYQSALEVSGTWCLQLHYSEAVKSISLCLLLHGHVAGPLGMAAWLEMAGTRRWCLRQSGGSGGLYAQPTDQTTLARAG